MNTEQQAGRQQRQKVKELMAKKILAVMIFSFIGILLISGCQTQFGKTQEIKSVPLHTGTQGIEMSFVQKMPPEEVRKGTTFNVGLEIRNKGSWAVTNVKLLIGGYDNSYVRMTGDNAKEIPDFEVQEKNFLYNIKKLNGKTTSNLEGGYFLLVMNGENIRIPASAESYESNIIATACYGYETEASQDVCLDPFANEVKQITKPCTVKDYTLSGGQGGPVGVTKIEESILSFDDGTKKAEFKIYIGNSGKGQVVNLSSYGKTCSLEEKITDDDINVVEISAYLGGKDIDCYTEIEKAQKVASLKLGKEANYVVCKTIIDPQKIFTTPLVIKLRYGYVSTVSKRINFK